MEDRTAGYELLTQVVGLDIEGVDTDVQETPEDVVCIVDFRIDEDDVPISAFGLTFALGVLSFADARPRGVSGVDFEEDDEWTVADMLGNLRFEHGELYFYADYVRGRMMKTEIRIRRDGQVRLRTVHRGTSARRWVDRLQGKKPLRVVEPNE